jgi:energy-coupling factor transporter transmembrane protein EcfT
VRLDLWAGFNNMTFYSGIIMNLIYLGISVYVCYSLLRPVRTYRQTFVVPTSLLIFSLFILLLGVAWSAYSDKDVYSKMNIEDIYNWLKSSDNKFFTPASYDVLKDDTVNIFEKNHDAIVNYLNQIFDSNLAAKQNAAIVAFSIFLGVGAGAFVSLIVTWSMNPKMDREKVMKLQTEIQLQMQYAMQGQKYDIDKSLFVPEAEYNAVMNKINEKLNKRRSN